jgi:hypothetical protein
MALVSKKKRSMAKLRKTRLCDKHDKDGDNKLV